MLAATRTGELNQLLSDLAAVTAGTASGVLIEGPAGSGRTQLLDAFVARAHSLGQVTVLAGGCDRKSMGDAYWAVTQLLQAAPAAPPETTATLAGRLSDVVLRYLEAGPVVLVLRQAEWCDEPSLRWLALLLQRCVDRPLMVVLSQRPSALPVWRRFLGGLDSVVRWRRITLATLDDNDVRSFAARWWNDPVDPEFARICRCLSAGLPGLLEPLLARVHAAGHQPDAAGARLAATVGADLLAAHLVIVLAGLPLQVSQVARALAVLGRTEVEPVALLAGVPAALVPKAIEALRVDGMPAPDSGGFPVFRTAALAGMTEPERTSAHTRAARVLNDIGSTAEEISTHLLLLPELPDRWMLGVLQDAANQAERRGNVATAVRLRERLLRSGSQPVEQLIAYARVLVHLDARQAHALIATELAATTNVRTRAVLAVQFGKSAIMVGQVPEAVRLLTAVLEELLPLIGSDPTERDRRLWTRAEAALLSLGWNEQTTVRMLSARAKAIRSPAGHDRGEREVLAVQAVTAALAGSTASEAVTLARKAIRAEPAPESWMFAAASYVLSLADEVEEGLQALDRICEHSAQRGLIWVQVSGLTLRAAIRQRCGGLPRARADAELALELSERQLWGPLISVPQVTLAAILVQQGEAEAAFDLLDRAQLASDQGAVLIQPALLMTRSAVSLAIGDQPAALEYALRCGRFLAATGVTNPLFLPWWLEAAPLLVAAGREHEARKVIEHGTALAGQWGTATAHGLVLLAWAAVLTGSERVQILRSAVLVLSATPSSWYRLRAEVALAEALAALGDEPGARKHRQHAVEVAGLGGYRLAPDGLNRADLQPRPALVVGSARQGLAASGPRSGPGVMLTPSEQRVAELAVHGATNREIAGTLVIALRTVEIHLTSAYRKLGIRRRAELAQALGLIAVDRSRPSRRNPE